MAKKKMNAGLAAYIAKKKAGGTPKQVAKYHATKGRSAIGKATGGAMM